MRKLNSESRAVAMVAEGRSEAQIAHDLGISAKSVRIYLQRHERAGKPAPERCPWCPLLAPCTCTGPMRAVDYMRSGEPAAGGLMLAREMR